MTSRSPATSAAGISIERLFLGGIRTVLVLHHRGQKARRGRLLHRLPLPAGKGRKARRPGTITLLGAPRQPRRPPAECTAAARKTPVPASCDGSPRPPHRPRSPTNPDTSGSHPPTAPVATAPSRHLPATPPSAKTPGPPPRPPPADAASGNSQTTPTPAETPSVSGPSIHETPPDPFSSTTESSSSSRSWLPLQGLPGRKST